MRRKILLGLTGSVASVLYEKLIEGLSEVGDVTVICTDKANTFINRWKLLQYEEKGIRVYSDRDEWSWSRNKEACWYKDEKWQKDDPILHIALRDSHSALVIAPCSANTLAKISNGICDNLLTSVARAWDFTRPFFVAPAMNSHMWNHPITAEQISRITDWGIQTVFPQSKMLACKTEGMGALAKIEQIVHVTHLFLKWNLPIFPEKFSGIPVGNHPGAFSTQRKHEKHTGLDLYCMDDTNVFAVESGTVVNIEHFTGEWDNSPWWENTDCIMIEGATGVVCYGEVSVPYWISVGRKVFRGEHIANVKRVLKQGKERPDIPGHRTSMLHMELYPFGTRKASNGFEENLLQDPTPFLLEATNAHKVKKLEYHGLDINHCCQ